MLRSVLIPLSCVILLTGCSSATNSGTDAGTGPTAQVSTAAAPGAPESPVATLLGKPVYRHDCLSKSSGIGSAEAGIVNLVLAELSQEICDPKSIKLTTEEIDAFWKVLRSASSDGGYSPPESPGFDEQQVQQQLEDIRAKLAASDVGRLERVVLEGQQHAAERALELKSVPATVAYAELLPIRCQAAIHKKYGGKVVTRQMTIDPAEAYLKLAKDAEKEGKLEFHDRALEQAFWQQLEENMNQPEVSAERVDFSTPLTLQLK